ncbi:MAG: cupin domain-containing protein [Pseudomonadales bacterium]
MSKTASLGDNFSISAQMIFNGSFCGGKHLGKEGDTACGHMHFLRAGVLTLLSEDGHRIVLDKPSVIVLPRSTPHQILSEQSKDVDLVCAAFHFDEAAQRQLIDTLPAFIYMDLDEASLAATADWIYREADSSALGQRAIVDKLCEVFLIQMLRNLIEDGFEVQGMLAGLSHPKLAPLLLQLEEDVSHPWSLEAMAQRVAMSRSAFAALFRKTLGQTPNDYLTDLRLASAQQMLRQDKAVSLVANSVGYENSTALARIFRKKLGLSPREWLQRQRAL